MPGCRWDEDVFGLEYDLDLFNIVAVDDFNMGGCNECSLGSRCVEQSAALPVLHDCVDVSCTC